MSTTESDSQSGEAISDQLTPAERRKMNVLIIEGDSDIRDSMRSALKDLGYQQVVSVIDHIRGLEKFQERRFSHVIFDARKTNMSPDDFLTQIIRMDETIVAIPTSFDPSIDNVFNLVVNGAKGYLVKPFQTTTLEEAMIIATKSPPIHPAIKQAKDRNKAFAIITLSALDDLATIIRQAQRYETAKRELPLQLRRFRRTVEMGRQFRKGTLEDLLASYIEYALEMAKGPATKMGRRRQRVRRKRKNTNTGLRIPGKKSEESDSDDAEDSS